MDKFTRMGQREVPEEDVNTVQYQEDGQTEVPISTHRQAEKENDGSREVQSLKTQESGVAKRNIQGGGAIGITHWTSGRGNAGGTWMSTG